MYIFTFDLVIIFYSFWASLSFVRFCTKLAFDELSWCQTLIQTCFINSDCVCVDRIYIVLAKVPFDLHNQYYQVLSLCVSIYMALVYDIVMYTFDEVLVCLLPNRHATGRQIRQRYIYVRIFFVNVINNTNSFLWYSLTRKNGMHLRKG